MKNVQTMSIAKKENVKCLRLFDSFQCSSYHLFESSRIDFLAVQAYP